MNEFHYLAMSQVNQSNDDDNDDNDNNDDGNEEENNEEDMEDKEPENKEKKKRILHNKHLIDCGTYLLSKGTDIKAASETGITPLLLALDNGNKEFALWLMENGASTLGTLSPGQNIIFVLADNVETYGIKKILKQLKKSSKKDLEELKELLNKTTDNGDGY